MHKVDISMERDLFEANKKIADGIRADAERTHTYIIDFMGSIGSGKTLLIEQLITLFADRNVGVVVGDVTGDDDYQRIKKYGVPVININTGKECHLDAHLVQHALEHLRLEDIDLLFIENIGNLVCPADFDLGSNKRGVVISVTEGDDMVRKHPLIFQIADFIVVNKKDLIPHMDIDVDRLVKDIKTIAGKPFFITNAKTGEGLSELATWLVK
jgi:hydrogenase nickel incorporation protein HypB